VGVRIDQAGGHRATAGVEPIESLERIALRREEPLEVGEPADAEDAALPDRDGRRVRGAGSAR